MGSANHGLNAHYGNTVIAAKQPAKGDIWYSAHSWARGIHALFLTQETKFRYSAVKPIVNHCPV